MLKHSFVNIFKMPTRHIKFLESGHWGRSLCRLIVVVAFITFISYSFQSSQISAFGQAEVPSKQVLLLHAQDQFLPANIVMDQTLHSALKNDQTMDINIYSEYLEKVRFNSDLIQNETVDILHAKYDELGLDLIIITDDLSWDFYKSNGEEVFKGVPVVLCGITDGKLKASDIGENMTGNYKKLDIKGDIETILSVQPDTKQIDIIVGTSAQDAYYENITRQAFKDFNGKFKTEYLTGLGIEEIQKRISELPPNTVILYVSMYIDGKGQGFNPRDVIPLLKKTANAPIYGVSDTYLGYGILGGNLLSFTDLSQNAAEIAIKVLKGTKPSDIPIQVLKNKNYFDWNEMQLWGIKEGQLPKDSIIVNKAPGIWDLYKAQIIFAICCFGLLLILVFALLWQLYSRKKAQAELLIASKSLNESEDKFRYIFENSVVGNSLTLPSGEMEVNSAMGAMLGYTTTELKGKPWQEITHLDDIEKSQLEVNALMSGEKATIRFTKRYIKKDGSIMWSDVLSSIRRDADGKPLYLITSIVDITERIHSEEALSESEAFLHAAFNNSQAGIAIADAPDGKLRYVNKAGLLIRNKAEEDIVENIDINQYVSSWNILHLDGTPYKDDEVPLARAVLYGETCAEEFMIRRDNNEDRVVLAKAAPIKDANEKIIAGIVVFLDITEQKQNEKNIKRQNEIMEALLAVLPVGVFMVDADTGNPLLANDMARNLLGMGILPDATQKNFDEVYKGHRKGCTTPYPAEELPLVYGMKGISSHIDDLVVERPDGTEMLLEVYGTPLLDEEGKPWASLAAFSDITERTRAYEELDEALKFNEDIINSARNGVIVYDTELRYKVWNPFMENISGFSAREVLGQSIEKIFPWHKETGVIDSLKLVLEGKSIDENLFQFNITKTGKVGWALDSSGPLYNRKGDVIGVLGFVQDVTERTIANDLLIDSEERYRLLITKMEQGLALHKIILDKEGKPVDYRFLEMNESFEKITGLKRDNIIGKTVREVLPDTEEYWIETYGKVALSGKSAHFENYSKELDKYFEVVAFSPEALHFAVLTSDITQRKKNEESILYLGYHDQLTGLYNRRFYEEELKRLDTKRNLPITLIMSDVNGLKLTNDAFGHQAGDALLQTIAELLKNECRSDEIISRIGGDEFVILLPKTDAATAKKLIQRIGNAINKEASNNALVSVSIRYAVKDNMLKQFDEIYKEAEDDMYRHKLTESSSFRSKSIDIIMNSLYEKSSREMNHSKRVSYLCEQIASNLNFSEEEIRECRVAGLVHDIGKMGVSNSILDKDGKLTTEEWAEMKKHSEMGYRILGSVVEFSEIANYVLSHQERWDGKGYPQALKGDQIPIQSRIIAVADSFDAMTVERSYKKVMSESEAISEIKKCAGTQFDTNIAKTFVEKVLGDTW